VQPAQLGERIALPRGQEAAQQQRIEVVETAPRHLLLLEIDDVRQAALLKQPRQRIRCELLPWPRP